MRSSFRLITIRGIDLRLHITFPLIFVWAALQFGLLSGNIESALFGVIAITLLFILVTLHELGHSIAAQYYGITVRQIILSPIGGVAQLSRIPEKPLQELVIAIAGPAVNLIVALVMFAVVISTPIYLTNPALALLGTTGFSLTYLFSYVFFYNILLALFNLIPAFPLDGGRIFRALLALRLDYVTATRVAAMVGRVTAVLIGFFGIFNGGFFLVFIAIFIFIGAGQESNYVRIRSALRGYTVREIYSAAGYRLHPDNTVQQAKNLMVFGRQRNFPVVIDDDLVGFLFQSDLVDALPRTAAHTRVGTVMRTDMEPVSLGDDLFSVQQRLLESKLLILPVVDGGQFMGTISLGQISNLLRQVLKSPQVNIQKQSA